jgi:hypothetical protein
MKIKILILSIVLVLIIGLGAGAFWWMRQPQVVTFGDDSKLTLLAVDYGKRHVPPVVKATATTTGKTPAARPVRRGGGTFTTPTDTLVLWVRQEYDSQQYHNFQYYISDKANTACVETYGRNYGNNRQGNEVVAVQIDSFPRRQGKFIVRVQENGNGGQEMSDKKFVISNPARGSFAKWTAEPLPATKEDGDLAVTLTKLVFGAGTPYQRDQDNADDPVNKGVQATFQVSRNGKPVTTWQPVSIVTSDATGNSVGGGPNCQWNGDEDVTTYQWGLWSDEPAWKIKLEFSQQSDFSPQELWTVQNIPFQPARQQDMWNYGGRNQTNGAAFAETDLNGVHLKIYQAKQFTDVNQNSNPQGGLYIQTNPDLPEGMRMTLLSMTDDQGNNVEHWDYGQYRNNNISTYRYGLRDVLGATNLNLTIALHKSRFVEFTAKPEKASAAAAQ